MCLYATATALKPRQTHAKSDFFGRNALEHFPSRIIRYWILFVGGWDRDIGDYLDDVLMFDEEAEVWQKVGTMTMARGGHGVSVINFNEIRDYCGN